jgi:hypothetical protein
VGTECSMVNVQLSGQAANDVSGRFIRSAGLSCHSHSSNQTNQTNQTDQMNRIIPRTLNLLSQQCLGWLALS